jgi:spore germination cell wall hydrolase CwlJ-like protein
MKEVDCLARNIYFEAGAEPRLGKIAVAEVTMNRVKNKHYPKTVCEVVHQRTRTVCQFSWVCEGKGTIVPNATWRESRKIAESILISKRKYGIIGEAKFFHADYVYPNWADTKEVVAQIGQHIFYR